MRFLQEGKIRWLHFTDYPLRGDGLPINPDWIRSRNHAELKVPSGSTPSVRLLRKGTWNSIFRGREKHTNIRGRDGVGNYLMSEFMVQLYLGHCSSIAIGCVPL